jgi:hypothetical protein
MQRESIEHVKKRLIEDISRMEYLPLQDKVELMINLLNFLNDYEENIKVLQKYKSLKLGG